MTILSRMDAWLGKTLFHPPIIMVCQLAHQSQYALHRALWFFACCFATYHAQGSGWALTIFLWFWTIANLINATVNPDRPAQSWGFLRFWFWLLLAVSVGTSMLVGHVTAGTVLDVILLFAEYAATIRTIPPRKKREARGLREARS